jgi:hypothetical protein
LVLALAYLPAPSFVTTQAAAVKALPIGGLRGFGDTALQQLARLLQVFLPLIAGLPFSLLFPSH